MNTYQTLLVSTLLSSALLFSATSHAIELPQLQQRWAEIKYQQTGKQQESAYQALLTEASAARVEHANDANYLIWEGIIRSTYAGAVGGLSALSEVKAARKLFEQAIELDANALDGSAYTSLGSLYYQVPGWPVGFGSDKKAREYLLKGLAVNPNGIDANYFYGDFLLQQKDYQAAIAAFEKALAAPDRPGREQADLGRRQEIMQALSLAQQKAK
ncbi:MAG: hypothetical protein NWQ42_03590 [Alishewanella sp.]|nr:hypothetical protein [Alishewanella sp.]